MELENLADSGLNWAKQALQAGMVRLYLCGWFLGAYGKIGSGKDKDSPDFAGGHVPGYGNGMRQIINASEKRLRR